LAKLILMAIFPIKLEFIAHGSAGGADSRMIDALRPAACYYPSSRQNSSTTLLKLSLASRLTM